MTKKNSQWNTPIGKFAKYFALGSIFLFVLLIVLTPDKELTPEQLEQARKREQRQRAYECHLSTVTSNLLAPSTAEFPYYEEVPIIWLDSSLYHIRGYVDAQNAFGAMIRINYDCEVWAEPYCQVRSFKLID